ncbi:MAG: RagB/SusD family nutrient uptake outer membrane protein [Tannerella sp.]|jgi:hypothetical protein|nr:RagB/SusD family nutrient uptake outer membrane protein [Tannerella sp.]
MKKIKYLLLTVCLGLSFESCETLDLEAKGILDDNALLSSESGLIYYIAGLYSYLPIEDFNYSVNNGYRWGNYWEALKQYQGAICGEVVGWQWGVDAAGGFEYWPYDRIRRVNTLIEKLPDVKSKYREEVYNAYMGEARFLRAFYYFGLVKRYGGVPIVETVQDPKAPAEELQVYRATESDTYKFIQSDLLFAIDNMSATSDKGRGTKYAAAALLSRAMLYAGRIAKYGGYNTSSPDEAAKLGYVGIPASEANYFFQAAVDAAKVIESNGNIQLVGEDLADNLKEQNYVDLFLKDNAEDIMVKYFSTTAPGGQLNHSWDGCTMPSRNGRFASWPGSEIYPTLETVELFQKLPVEDADDKPIRFNDRADLMKGLEPRLLASVYFHGMSLRGNTVDLRRGVYKTYKGTQADAQLGVQQAPINDPSNRLIASGFDTYWDEASFTTTGDNSKPMLSGQDGCVSNTSENSSITGFFVRKYVDYNLPASQAGGYGSQTAFKVFRLAEVLLNHAEAAYELNQKSEAYALIDRIRKRAGAVKWEPKGAPGQVYVINNQVVDENLQYIRDERCRELFCEQHRWWDIRSWRVADKYLNQFKPSALMPYLVLDENKYIFIREYIINDKRFNFEVRYWYENIPNSERNKNPNLVPNPIY